MIRLIEFLIALAIVLVLFLVVGLVLPDKRHLEESVETNRRMTIVFDTVNNIRRLRDWNQMIPHAPEALSYSGGEDGAGVGARVDFTYPDARWGSGHWEITDSQMPSEGSGGRVAYAIEDSRPGSGKRSEVILEPAGRNGRNVRITQTYDVEYGWNLLGRFQGMYVSRNVGDSVKSGLSRLSQNLSTIPNFDYRIAGSKLTGLALTELPAENLLVVNAGNIDRNNEVIKASIRSNQEWIKRVMDNNGLEAAGPVRIITTDFGSEKYAFDVAQPVRKRRGGAASTDDDEAGSTAPPIALPGSAEPIDVKVEGTPVEYVRLEPRRAATASYTGYMAELDAVRNSLRAWAMTNGHEVIDRPYESWKGGVDPAFTAEGTFDVFWQVKQ